jgi:hypothetical protein
MKMNREEEQKKKPKRRQIFSSKSMKEKNEREICINKQQMYTYVLMTEMHRMEDVLVRKERTDEHKMKEKMTEIVGKIKSNRHLSVEQSKIFRPLC